MPKLQKPPKAKPNVEAVALYLKTNARPDTHEAILDLVDDVVAGNFNTELLNNVIRFAGRTIPTGTLNLCGVAVLRCTKCRRSCYAVGRYYNIGSHCESCLSEDEYCGRCDAYRLKQDDECHIHLDEERVEKPLAFNTFIGGPPSLYRCAPHERNRTYNMLRYFGVELELEKKLKTYVPPDLVGKVYRIFPNFGYVKRDGSLSQDPAVPGNGSNGFEVVTLPGTLDYHRNHAGWDKFFRVFKSWMQEKPDTTGLHFHVNLASMTKATLAKVTYFINDPINLEFLELIADRDFSKQSRITGRYYCQRYDPRTRVRELISRRSHLAGCPMEKVTRESLKYYGKVSHDQFGHPVITSLGKNQVPCVCKCPEGRYAYPDHYSAFNVLTKKETAELRIFQGSTNIDHFFASLEFFDALIVFCTDAHWSELTYSHFWTWLKKQRKMYPALFHFLNQTEFSNA